jgi:arsenite methyltransferase
MKPDYGIDAPEVIRNFFIASVCGFLLAIFIPRQLHLGTVILELRGMGWGMGLSFAVAGSLMLLYAKAGKFRQRDRMLNLHVWRGDEQVLDVGTGRGLLLVGAARRLTSGHATGIDIWNREDLSGNSLDRTERNIALEGVTEKCSLVSEGVQEMGFPNESFDVILSNLCLHNIYDKPTRKQACIEIVRVLKPGGSVILSDYKLTSEYARILREAGLQVERKFPNLLTTFPALTIVWARKPNAGVR